MAAEPPVLLGLRDAAMAGPCRGGGQAPAWATSKLGGSAVGPGGRGVLAGRRRRRGGRARGPRRLSQPRPCCCWSFRTGRPRCGRARHAASRAGGRWPSWCRCTARWRGPPSTAPPTSSPAAGRAAGERPAGEGTVAAVGLQPRSGTPRLTPLSLSFLPRRATAGRCCAPSVCRRKKRKHRMTA